MAASTKRTSLHCTLCSDGLVDDADVESNQSVHSQRYRRSVVLHPLWFTHHWKCRSQFEERSDDVSRHQHLCRPDSHCDQHDEAAAAGEST